MHSSAAAFSHTHALDSLTPQAKGAVAPLSGRFLVDEEELRRKQEEVANQSKLRYGELEEGAAAAAA